MTGRRPTSAVDERARSSRSTPPLSRIDCGGFAGGPARVGPRQPSGSYAARRDAQREVKWVINRRRVSHRELERDTDDRQRVAVGVVPPTNGRRRWGLRAGRRGSPLLVTGAVSRQIDRCPQTSTVPAERTSPGSTVNGADWCTLDVRPIRWISVSWPGRTRSTLTVGLRRARRFRSKRWPPITLSPPPGGPTGSP